MMLRLLEWILLYRVAVAVVCALIYLIGGCVFIYALCSANKPRRPQ